MKETLTQTLSWHFQRVKLSGCRKSRETLSHIPFRGVRCVCLSVCMTQSHSLINKN